MSYISQAPQKDKNGIYHCKDCDMIISPQAHYCDKCDEKRTENTKNFFKKYWWVIVGIIIILLILGITL